MEISDKVTLAKWLFEQGFLWSYAPQSAEQLPDSLVIEQTLRFGDVAQIQTLFHLFDYPTLEKVWLENLLPDERAKKLNHYLAKFFFTKTDFSTHRHESRADRFQRLIAENG